MTKENSCIFFFRLVFSMSWFALHLHYGRAMVSRKEHSTSPALFYVFASQKTYWYKRKCPDCRRAIGTKKKMYVGNLPLLVFFLVKQQSIFGIHWRYYRLACFLFQFHAGIAGNFASFLRDMHVFTKCLRIAIF